MSENSLDLHIRTTADNSGLQSTTQATKELRDETERYHQALQRMASIQEDETLLAKAAERKLALAERNAKAKEYEIWWTKELANAEAAGAAEKAKAAELLGQLSFKTQDLQKAFAALGREFPGIAQAARTMLNPIALAVTGAVTAYTHFRHELDEMNKAMDESARKAASSDFAQGMAAKKEALREASTALAEFGIALRNAMQDQDTFGTKTDEAKSKLREFTNAQAEIEDAAEARDLALVDEAQKGGKLSEAQAITQRAAIKEQYRRKRVEAKNRAEEEELKLAEQELQQARASDEKLIADALDAKSKRDALDARLKQAKADKAKGDEKFTEYQADAVKALEELAEAQNSLDNANAAGAHGGLLATMGRGKLEEAQRKADEAVRRRDAQGRMNAKNQALLGEIESDFLPTAQNDWDTANRKAVQNRSKIGSLSRSIPVDRENFETRRHTRQTIDGLQTETAQAQAMTQLHETLKKQGDEEKQTVQQIASAIKSGDRSSTLKDLLAIVQKLHQDEQDTKYQISTLRAQIAAKR